MRTFKFFPTSLWLICGCLLVGGCVDKPTEFSRIEAISATPGLKINQVRFAALKQAANGLGAQAGLAWRSKQINELLQNQSSHLNKIFDFNSMLLDSNVLPPVLVEGRDTLNVDNSTTLRLSDRDYSIIYPPRFVTVAPTWRDYLMMNFKRPETPDVTLLPKSADERKVWNKYIRLGWNEGVNQATEIFNTNLALLQRDFDGMVLYKKLYAQHIVSAPFVAKADLGITGDGNSMHVNDRVLRITAQPEFNPDSKNWKPVFTGDN